MNIVKKVALISVIVTTLSAATLAGARYHDQVSKAQNTVTNAVKSGVSSSVEFIKEKLNRSEQLSSSVN